MTSFEFNWNNKYPGNINFNELQLLTEKDIKWLESLSKNPTLTQKKYEFPHELFEDILCEEDNLIKKENDKY